MGQLPVYLALSCPAVLNVHRPLYAHYVARLITNRLERVHAQHVLLTVINAMLQDAWHAKRVLARFLTQPLRKIYAKIANFHMGLLAFHVTFPSAQYARLTTSGLSLQVSASPLALSNAVTECGSINLRHATMEMRSMEMAAIHYAR
jgi:hypothetical protein